MIMILRILKAIAYPFRRLFDLIHNGQDDIQGCYPEAFHRPVRKRLGRVQ